jgi:hypothetical protein
MVEDATTFESPLFKQTFVLLVFAVLVLSYIFREGTGQSSKSPEEIELNKQEGGGKDDFEKNVSQMEMVCPILLNGIGAIS